MTPAERRATNAAASGGMPHLLSFDVEEYFQVQAAREAGLQPEGWCDHAPRLDDSVDRILDLLSAHGASATFFVLGWVARHETALVRRIASAGHEIASHGMTHTMLDQLTAEAFRDELRDSRAILEDISGRPVLGYRAPTFSITRQTAWALDVLAEAGYTYDSSIFPVRHDRYGVPDAPAEVHEARGPGGGTVLEIPPATLRVLGHNMPVGGGGYLRLLPIWLIGRCLRGLERAGRPGMIYLHPWEFDAGQPHLPMGRLGLWRHRVGLGRTAAKLTWLLERFSFRSVAQQFDILKGEARRQFVYGPTR